MDSISYKRFRIASKNHKEEGEIQSDSLIYALDVKEGEKILKTFTFAEGQSRTDFDCLVTKFEEHFIPVVNVRYTRAKFTIPSNPMVNPLKHLSEISRS